jgi:hypothetical protein
LRDNRAERHSAVQRSPPIAFICELKKQVRPCLVLLGEGQSAISGRAGAAHGTRPLVEAPQMKKVKNRIQNTGDVETSRSVPSAAAMIGAEFGGGAGSGSLPSSPNGRKPTRSGGRASSAAPGTPKR